VYIFGFLVFISVVVGLFCQYRSQVIGWKDSVSEMTCYVLSGTLNSTRSLTLTWYRKLLAHTEYKCVFKTSDFEICVDEMNTPLNTTTEKSCSKK